jgi:hypothetical protein
VSVILKCLHENGIAQNFPNLANEIEEMKVK